MYMRRAVVVPDPLALEKQVCFALSVASRSVVAVYRPFLEPMGLTHPQYLVMLALWQRSPLTVTELGESLQLEPATLSPLLKRLESNGLINRQRDPADERSLRLTVTEDGRKLRSEALKIPGKIMARLDMGVDELTELHGTLTRLIERANS
jgi:DNA-binding MarR family transcriptional regulator